MNNIEDKAGKLFDLIEHNPIAWGMLCFPHHFRDPSPPFHLELVKHALREKYLAIAAPRESAKSTIIAFLYVFHAIVFKRKKFIIIIGSTESKAKEHLESIKKE